MINYYSFKTNNPTTGILYLTIAVDKRYIWSNIQLAIILLLPVMLCLQFYTKSMAFEATGCYFTCCNTSN